MDILAVDPLPWARAQMAFTLAVHIVLVPLGVSWAVMILIANYRAIKHADADAMRLAQRWSKVLAVTFAVGAVTGTMLTFEFGLLWPEFMNQWGDVFGIPFAIEGLFFFTEAIFIGIYLYGWKHLRPWPHFWSGVPIAVAGIGGSFAVVTANAWMNQPAGFTLDAAGKVIDVDPLGVIFNQATPYETTHMIVAAYLVGGFMVASVYAFAMLRGRKERYYRLGFIIPFTVAAIATPVQMIVGDFVARSVFKDQPVKFAAMELVDKTSTDVPETLGGFLDSDGNVRFGIPIPGLASLLSGGSTSTEIAGLDSVPPEDRPTLRQVNVVHLAWDVMIGLGTALLALVAWFAFVWWRRRALPRSRWFLRFGAISGVAAVLALEAGWVVTEVGRQPWIVYEIMRVEDAVTGNSGVWITFLGITALYTAMVVALVLVLRAMARGWRAAEAVGDADAHPHDTPYGPRSRRERDTESV